MSLREAESASNSETDLENGSKHFFRDYDNQ